ncbi:MAG: NAD(P)-dependent oxidoreductase [Planctomycetota bacterium]
MKVALTGATGFVGRAVLKRLIAAGHYVRCSYRPDSDRSGLESLEGSIEWVEGALLEPSFAAKMCDGVDQVIHSAFWRPGKGFRNAEGDLIRFAQTNIIGSLQLMESAFAHQVSRFVFVSTCAVHEQILDDRKLDEAHPLWPLTHYGAHKAAIEKFVHSFGLGNGQPICAIRPTGIYGMMHPAENSKWYDLVSQIVNGDQVEVTGGGKEIHVDDVAKGIETLMQAPIEKIRGKAFACYDRYISRFDVANLAKEISGSGSTIEGKSKSPKHEIDTTQIKNLGMKFGGVELLKKTIQQMVDDIRS